MLMYPTLVESHVSRLAIPEVPYRLRGMKRVGISSLAMLWLSMAWPPRGEASVPCIQALQASRELKVTIGSKSHDPIVHAKLHVTCMQLGPFLPSLSHGCVLYLVCARSS